MDREKMHEISWRYADEFAGLICSEEIDAQFPFNAVKRHVAEAIFQALLEVKRDGI